MYLKNVFAIIITVTEHEHEPGGRVNVLLWNGNLLFSDVWLPLKQQRKHRRGKKQEVNDK